MKRKSRRCNTRTCVYFANYVSSRCFDGSRCIGYVLKREQHEKFIKEVANVESDKPMNGNKLARKRMR